MEPVFGAVRRLDLARFRGRDRRRPDIGLSARWAWEPERHRDGRGRLELYSGGRFILIRGRLVLTLYLDCI